MDQQSPSEQAAECLAFMCADMAAEILAGGKVPGQVPPAQEAPAATSDSGEPAP